MIARVVVRRLAAAIVVFFIVSLAVFSLVLIVPGDPAIAVAGETADQAYIDAVRDDLGLNDPIIEQYGRWLGGAFRGDFGESLVTGQDVLEGLWIRLPATVSLMVVSLTIAVLIGLPAGIIAGLRPGSIVDRVVSTVASVGVATPNFWVGLLLVIVFSVNLGWLPAIGYTPLTEDPWGWLQHLILPGITLGSSGAAELARQTRAGVADVRRREFVRTAHAMGLPRRSIVGRHILKNASLPVVTVLGFQIAYLLGGSVVVESVFGIDGIGKYAITAATQRDFPVVQGMVLLVTVIVLIVNLAVDLSYSLLDPRTRTS